MIAALSRPAGRTDTTRTRRLAAPAPTAPAAKPAPWYSREGVYFAAVRDVSDETRQAMARAQCLRAWYAIHEALHDQARRGRTEFIRDRARIGVLEDVGIKGLCRYAGGADPKTMRRQLACLEQLGLVKAIRPAVRFELRDGRLHKAKGQGREEAVKIMVTVDAERHCRPSKRQVIGQAARRAVAGSYGEPLPPSTPAVMGSLSLPSRDSIQQKENETPADTVGVGAAVASTDAGLTAGQAGRQEPANAGGLAAAVQEGGQADAAPVLPPPRRQPARQASAPRQAPPQTPPPAPPVRWMDQYRPTTYRRPWERRDADADARPASTPSTPPEAADATPEARRPGRQRQAAVSRHDQVRAELAAWQAADAG